MKNIFANLYTCIFGLCLLVIGSTFTYGQNKADDVIGIWKTEPKEDGSYAHVEVFESGSTYSGKIAWLSQPKDQNGKPKVDSKNPDKGKQNTPLLGLGLLHNFKFDGKENWEEGFIYDPSKGETYKCYMWLENINTLKVKGYIGISLIGRTATWTRVGK